MKNTIMAGDTRTYVFTVKQEDVAAFHGETIHPVCSTFALAREIEWTTRQFVLDMRDEDEEGIGTFLSIDHRSPAMIGDKVQVVATVESINGHELTCAYQARVGNNVVAMGKTGQKILKKEKLKKIMTR